MALQANQDVLYYYQVMSTEDSNLFKEAMKKEVNSFIEEKIFQIIPLKDKSSYKLLIIFI